MSLMRLLKELKIWMRLILSFHMMFERNLERAELKLAQVLMELSMMEV